MQLENGTRTANEKRIAKFDALRLSVVVLAIAASALVFSMSVTSFFHIKESAIAILLVQLAVTAPARRADAVAGLRAFWPLTLFALLPFAFSLLPNYPHVPALMHREQARILTLILFGILAFDLMRDAGNRDRVVNAFIATAAAAALLAMLQRLGMVTFLLPEFEDAPDPLYTVFGNSGLLGGYLAMAMPFAVRRANHSPRFLAYLVALALLSPAIALSGSRAAWLAAAAGTLLVLPYRELRARRAFAVAGVIICSVGATLLQFQETRPGNWVSDEKQDTIQLRLWFWDGAGRMAADHPIIGVGPGNFQYWSPKYQGDALASNPKHTANEAHTQYAHNDPLQIVAETGLIGVLLCGIFLLRLVHCRGEAWGGLAAALAFGLFHFPLHSAPHALMMVLFATMLLAQNAKTVEPKKNPTRHGSRRILVGAIAATLAIVLAAITVYDVLMPSIAIRTANMLYADGKPATDAYEKAINTGRFHPEAHANYANALLDEGNLSEARNQLETALKGQDTGDLHLALAYIALQEGDRTRAQRHIEAAIHRWPNDETTREYLGQIER